MQCCGFGNNSLFALSRNPYTIQKMHSVICYVLLNCEPPPPPLTHRRGKLIIFSWLSKQESICFKIKIYKSGESTCRGLWLVRASVSHPTAPPRCRRRVPHWRLGSQSSYGQTSSSFWFSFPPGSGTLWRRGPRRQWCPWFWGWLLSRL